MVWDKEIALETMSIQQTLQAWSDETTSLLNLHKNAGGALSDQIKTKVLEKNTLFREPATEDEIREVEVRLNCVLPQSYRSFLQCSNGWSLVDDRNTALMLSPASRVELLSEVAPELYQAMNNYSDVRDEEYFIYGDDQKPDAIRASYLSELVSISPINSEIAYLLNPEVVLDDGEWEAWAYSPDIFDGAVRYRSFSEMMEAEAKRINTELSTLLEEKRDAVVHIDELSELSRIRKLIAEEGYEEAEKACLDLASKGSAEAMNLMAIVLEEKIDQPQWKEIEKWLILSAEYGYEFAPGTLSGLYAGPEYDPMEFDYKYPPEEYPLTDIGKSLFWYCVSLVTEGHCKVSNGKCITKKMHAYLNDLGDSDELYTDGVSVSDLEGLIGQAQDWLKKYRVDVLR